MNTPDNHPYTVHVDLRRSCPFLRELAQHQKLPDGNYDMSLTIELGRKEDTPSTNVTALASESVDRADTLVCPVRGQVAQLSYINDPEHVHGSAKDRANNRAIFQCGCADQQPFQRHMLFRRDTTTSPS